MALVVAASVGLSGCLVEGLCFGDGDCQGGRICQDGECVWECQQDEHCPGCRRCVDRRCTQCCRNSDCGIEEVCEKEVCVPALGCLTCGALPRGSGVCLHGICIVAACEPGWHDANGIPEDGCEYACEPTNDGVELCDGVDNDCDGRIDEDFNLDRDPEHCGECNVPCDVPPNATPVCAGGRCYFLCDESFYDNDGEAGNGCEATECLPTNGGVEQCDLRDNDCNGEVDDGMIKDAAESCGPLCEPCHFPNASASCIGGACVMGACEEHHYNLDRDPDTGCEYFCIPSDPPIEVCDGQDNNCNGLIDEGLLCECPPDMALVEDAFCIDIYEASRPDASSTSMGTDTSRAVSQPGVMPWRNTSLQEAADACAAAGKRLCTPTEWEQACRGPEKTTYSYGDTYVPETCNGIDVFWPNFRIVPTGSFPECTNAYGVFDINGNVWERVQGGAGRGGAYNCGDSAALHKCNYVANWGTDPISNFGFRCCM